MNLRVLLRRVVRRSPAVASLIRTVRQRRGAALLARSGLVDERHYARQLGRAPAAGVARHYVAEGAAAGLSPHPLFDPVHYLAGNRAAARSAAAPFVEYLDVGCHRAPAPHPMFDPVAYADAVPGAEDHEFGPFGHFVTADEAPVPLPPTLARLAGGGTVSPAAWAGAASDVLAAVRARPGGPPTDGDLFDHELAAALTAEVRSGTADRDTPLVTVVLPTRDRRTLVEASIASVRAQTWTHWELLVVDDGGDDGTDELVAAIAGEDERVRYVRQDHAGVAAARNRGIAEGTGHYIAYIDSDNTWEPTFLEVMVGVLLTGGHRAAHAASELHAPDGTTYRARPVDPAALLAGNHVDCIVIVHERSLLDETGPFDEQLQRFVDWDLLLRMVRVEVPVFVPVVATRYDVGEAATHDRITTSTSIGWRDVVQARHLLARAPETPAVAVDADVAVVTTADEGLDPGAVLGEGSSTALVVVDRGAPVTTAAALRLGARRDDRVHVVSPPVHVAPAVARILGAARVGAAVTVLAAPWVRPTAGAVTALATRARVTGGIVGATMVDDAGLVVGGAVSIAASGEVVRWGTGRTPDDEEARPPSGPVVAEEGLVAVPTPLLRELGGPDPLFVGGGGVVDLCLRALDGGTPVEVAREVLVPVGDDATPGGGPTPADRASLASRWAGRGHAVPVEAPLGLVADRGRASSCRWSAGRVDSGRRRWSVATCVPGPDVAATWGDWHFGGALRDALVARGEHTVLDSAASRRRPTLGDEDVHVLLRGVNPIAPVPGRRNLLWVISHPEDVTDEELARVDHVFVAGAAAARALQGRSDTPTSVLHQCTDDRRFVPPTAGTGVTYDLLFVGNSRGRHRPILADAERAGLRPTVIGADWDGLVPPSWVVAGHVANADLPSLYGAAGVVLADHWEDMRRGGIVANRLFDVVAAGGVVVTDEVAGTGELFGDRVLTYAGHEDLAATVARARALPHGDGPVPRRVRAEHSFAARAATLVETVDALG